jgi:hypothetical protein
LLEDLDISSDLSSVGAPKADHPAQIAAIDEGNVVQSGSPRRESQDSHLPVVPPVVGPQQRGIPVELAGEGQRYAVLVEVELVLVGVELESLDLV